MTFDENLRFRGLVLFLDSPIFVYFTLVVNAILFMVLLYLYFLVMYDGKGFKLLSFEALAKLFITVKAGICLQRQGNRPDAHQEEITITDHSKNLSLEFTATLDQVLNTFLFQSNRLLLVRTFCLK